MAADLPLPKWTTVKRSRAYLQAPVLSLALIHELRGKKGRYAKFAFRILHGPGPMRPETADAPVQYLTLNPTCCGAA
jgi:hypothetical protein